MKVTVVTNDVGDIIAIGPASGRTHSDDPDAPTHFAIQAMDGQRVVETDLEEDLSDPKVGQGLHETHRVELKGKVARVVRREGNKRS